LVGVQAFRTASCQFLRTHLRDICMPVNPQRTFFRTTLLHCCVCYASAGTPCGVAAVFRQPFYWISVCVTITGTFLPSDAVHWHNAKHPYDAIGSSGYRRLHEISGLSRLFAALHRGHSRGNRFRRSTPDNCRPTNALFRASSDFQSNGVAGVGVTGGEQLRTTM